MTEKELWLALRRNGFNEFAAAGIMGNMRAESGLHPDRVQGDIPYSDWSRVYTERVDSGAVSREDFIHRGPGGGGYGLCQWTFWSRKQMLYDFAKQAGVSIGDGSMQVDFFTYEVRTNYRALYDALMSAGSVREASDVMLLKFERPAGMYEKREERAGYGMEFYNKYHGMEVTGMADTYRPMLQRGSRGDYVTQAQKALLAKGYSLPRYGADGDFGGEMYAAVVQFQRDRGLAADGIIGPDTWAALLAEESGNGETETRPEPAAQTGIKAVDIALGEVGYLEKASNAQLYEPAANAGYNNWNKYAYEIDSKWPAFYNGRKNGYAWCDCFADWCFLTAYGYEMTLKLLCAPERSCGAGCSFSAGYFRAKGRFFKTPEVGDQIFFGDYGNEYHVGLVYAVDGRYVYTVEGNTSSEPGVVPNGGGVFKKRYAIGNGNISGYGRPDYSLLKADKPQPEPEPETKPVTPDAGGGIRLDTLRFGAKGQQVKTMQMLLNGNGCPCGVADGDFGGDSLWALKKFQKASGLEVDGICDPATWERLLKG